MSDDHLDRDAMFLVAGYYAAQAYAQSQYNNRVNAYVARGVSIDEAHRIVRTWYVAYEPRRWGTGWWCLAAVGWIVLVAVMVTDAVRTSDNISGSIEFGLLGLAILHLRVRYCIKANEASEERAREAQGWLRERGL